MLAKLVTEAIGTFFLVFTIGMTVIDPGGAGDMAPLAIAAVLMVMIYAGGQVSGAHYNPAATLAIFLRGKCSLQDVGGYIAAQLLAAGAASGAVLLFKGDVQLALVDPGAGTVILAEFLFTFALCFVILMVATAKATAGNAYYGVAIAFTVLAGAYAVGGVSGGAFNPAVALSLGIMGLVEWTDLWMHLVGQLAGALAAVGAFRLLVNEEPDAAS